MPHKVRIAWFSAPSSVRSSISGYVSDLLLPHLAEWFEIECFSSQRTDTKTFSARNYLSAYQVHRQKPFELFFYNLEDNRCADFVRLHCGLIPGAVWFHDFFLTTDGPEPILNSAWTDVLQRYFDRSKEWPERGKEFKKVGVVASRESSLSTLPLFSSQRDHDEFSRAVPRGLSATAQAQTRSYFLPHPVRAELFEGSVSGDSIGFCGPARIESRAHKVLDAISKLGSNPPKLLWLLTGGTTAEAEGLVREYGISNYEIFGPGGPAEWEDVVNRCRVAIHTRFSVFGQPSPYLPISLARGVPTIVTNFGAAEIIPESVAFHIKPGTHEAHEIAEVLKEILRQPKDAFTEISRDYAREFHRVDAVAGQIKNIIEEEGARLALQASEWNKFSKEAAASLTDEALSCVLDPLARENLREMYRELGWIGEAKV